MIVTGFAIDGFGIFRDERVEEIAPGLTVITGDNESGKSTLMEFLRYVLFPPPRRSKDVNEYLPLRGGAHGGRLSAELAGGRVTFERIDRRPRIFFEHGPGFEEEPATRFFQSIERSTFQRVFALGLADLQELDVLSTADVRGRLALGGEVPIVAANRALSDGMQALLKGPNAKKPLLNAALNEQYEIQRRIATLGGQAAEYAARQERLRELEVMLSANREALKELTARRRRIDQLSAAREPWLRLADARRKLEELGDAREFPPLGAVNFRNFDKDIEDIQVEIGASEENLTKEEKRAAELLIDERALSAAGDIDALLGEREKLISALDDLPDRQADWGRAQAALADRLSDLGPDFTVLRIAQVDLSLAARQQAQDFAQRLTEASRRQQEAEARLAPHETDLTDADAAVQQAEQALAETPLPDGVDREALKRQGEALKTIRRLVHETEKQELAIASQRQAFEMAAAERDAPPEPSPPILAWWTPIAVGCVLAVMAGLGFFQSVALGITFLITGAALVAGLAWFLRQQRESQLSAARRQSERRDALARRLAEIEGQIAQLQSRRDALKQEMVAVAAAATMERPQDLVELDAAETRLAELAERLDTHRQWTARLEEARAVHAKAERELAETRNAHAAAASQLADAQRAWQAWLTERGFDATIAALQFGMVLQAVEAAHDAVKQETEARDRLKKVTDYIEATARRITEIAERTGVDHAELSAAMAHGLAAEPTGPPGDEEADGDDAAGNIEPPPNRRVAFRALDVIGRMQAALYAARKAKELQERLAENIERINDEQARYSRALAAKQAKRDKLLKDAVVEDADAFYAKAERHEAYQQAKQMIDEATRNLHLLAGSPEQVAELEQELTETDPVALDREDADLAEETASLEGRIDDDAKEIGELGGKIKEMAHDHQLAEQLQAREENRAEIDRLLRRWATLAICQGTIEKAQAVYETERQPAIIRRASEYLAAMTGGRYRLVAPPGQSAVQLEDTTGARKEEACWSSGLADQTYLAVRLSLAYEFGERMEPLPMILDDVLVRFDETRQAAAARVLLEFARTRQALVFSCHQATAKLLRHAAGESDLPDERVAFFTVTDGRIAREPTGVASAPTARLVG